VQFSRVGSKTLNAGTCWYRKPGVERRINNLRAVADERDSPALAFTATDNLVG